MDKIYGRKPVLETIDAGLNIHKAYIMDQKTPIVGKIVDKLTKNNVPIKYVDKNFFENVDMNHQGVMIEVDSYKYADLSELENANRLILLDKIEDPHNLGAIIRSAESFGFDGVIIPEHRSAKVTPTVYKTSAGAINNIKVVMVTNLNQTIENLKENGFWIYGLAGEASENIAQTNLTGKVGLVVGNEGDGLSRLVRENCDVLVKIPMLGKVNSLNASVASALSMYEVLRQNGFK
ncbi:MAG: 23S rRNA (guanosine(2251)-2'-O)-methyltransferase RlmB [Anaerococcus sp.]|jgi:RNA methyltransferase, trmH family, group 3|uniref:23S rRNA (guanosine(2251)-2'-O)-methyltransferase RlmB n=1 Tax=Anaerococcus TaxID=165779 RepID=UPI002353173E|nr:MULTISPECIES: 23S rRNA (guanosine(2251)-2'-O)-methyltransferase RlmB [Anaerococcus]MDU0894577.1 23S rRNA (guanosine(2251)-2'-O)-methyltransferase RlmB [Anaerococcus sp.]MDU4025243.1 23S rRNA (guanosine(2251)-2'-O)-methyltransferase RlmB [Anaerococcus sp.]MDU5535113.1 23S rRNA (guanosine(2251)-2'-O)-methyltransferase RlmB [Anaerococcus sp.]MDU7411985.1 23S rRNA (guanosine(2251)-2'-O)-methyltransferase RlmB [Anaerococcus sp.]